MTGTCVIQKSISLEFEPSSESPPSWPDHAREGVASIRRARQCEMTGTCRRVQGAGCRVQGVGFRVQGAGFRVQGSGCRVQGSGFRVQGSGCRVQGAGCRVQGLG